MDNAGVIILACVIIIAFISPITCILASKRRQQKKYNPSPDAFNKARRKLGTVADRRQYNGTPRPGTMFTQDGDADCPICIGPLYAPPDTRPSTSCSPCPQQGLDTAGSPLRAATSASSSTSSSDTPSMPSRPPTAKVAGASSEAAPSAVPDEIWSAQDMEILTLKNCRHSFHSRCLSSWFLIDRFDCPVCREPYWTPEPIRGHRHFPIDDNDESPNYAAHSAIV